ncbi:MAG: sulfur oxidation c-type cytochrome SoxA [Pseudomonadota bacterium]
MRLRRLATLTLLLAGAAWAEDGRRSGLQFMSPALQALQRDDAQNPAMLWVQDGEQLWRSPAGGSGKRCADCHGEAPRSMAGVAARYPAWDARSGGALNLAGRINACRQRHQQADLLPPEHADLLALSAYVGLQSRGLPLRPPDDARLAPLRQQGQELWQRRIGQLNLACLHCHDQRAGQRLGGAAIPQGHATGYPTYRLEWQALGSLQRRLRGCITGVRAEPWAVDAPEWMALEAWLAQRAAGMVVETPAVRP